MGGFTAIQFDGLHGLHGTTEDPNKTDPVTTDETSAPEAPSAFDSLGTTIQQSVSAGIVDGVAQIQAANESTMKRWKIAAFVGFGVAALTAIFGYMQVRQLQRCCPRGR